MNEVLGLAVLVGIGAWIYKKGKREGSRKAYHVGRKHRRRR